MTNKQQFLVEGIVGDMTRWLMEERNLSLQTALGVIYNSKTYELLNNPATGLYSESAAYNYELLNAEIKNGKFVQVEV